MKSVMSEFDRSSLLRDLVGVPALLVLACLLAGPVAAANSRTLAMGTAHTCVIDGGQVKCWGRNDSGQLGDGTIVQRNTLVTVSGISNATAVVAGSFYTCAIEGGQVKCWGKNDFGQLGDGSTVNRATTPVTVSGISSATALDAGDSHACAIVGGSVKCWGFNISGQLGNGTLENSNAPVTVSGITAATALATGGEHTCAIDGVQVKCWGLNSSGQLGNGGITTTAQNRTPVPVSASGTATLLTAGNSHTCAVFGAQLKCWGKNDSGQLGDGSTTNRTAPVTVSGIGTATALNVTALAGGFSHTCAIDGVQVKCWGSNQFGQLGDGSTTNHGTPVTVSGISSATALDTGDYHTCAIDNLQVKCWGLNNSGQIGDGTTTDRRTPVAVSSGSLAPPTQPPVVTPPVTPPPPDPTQPVAPPPVTQTEYTVTTGVIPPAAVSTTATGTLGSVTLNVTLNLSLLFPAPLFSGQGQFAVAYNVYVAALVPAGRLGLPASAWFMLPSTRSWAPLGSPIAAYLQNVEQSATVEIGILQNIDVTGLIGTEIYVGYGLNDQEMLATGRYRGVFIAR